MESEKVFFVDISIEALSKSSVAAYERHVKTEKNRQINNFIF